MEFGKGDRMKTNGKVNSSIIVYKVQKTDIQINMYIKIMSEKALKRLPVLKRRTIFFFSISYQPTFFTSPPKKHEKER